MEYKDYLDFLSGLCGQLDQLARVEGDKISAVRGYDLAALDECMKQEQAMALSLRGSEQKRDRMLSQLGLAGVSLRDLPKRCPPEYADETSQMVERLLRAYQILQSVHEPARSLLERQLHLVEGQLREQGVEPSVDTSYQPTPGQRPQSLRTDFKA